MNQDIQELLNALIGIFTLVAVVTVIICLCIKERKMDRLLKKERLVYADILKTLEALEKEIERKKDYKDIFIYPFSEN
jgi:hypothetical protein